MLPDDITTEYPGRTFAIIEIAVRRRYRRQGLSEEWVTLLVRPDAAARLPIVGLSTSRTNPALS